MEIQVILSILKQLQAAHFEENAQGNFLGTLVYQDKVFEVKLYHDAVCQYICLEYSLYDVNDIDDSIRSFNERVIAGRYVMNGNNLVLRSFFPIFEAKFIEQQVNNSICVIEKMIHICQH